MQKRQKREHKKHDRGNQSYITYTQADLVYMGIQKYMRLIQHKVDALYVTESFMNL